MNGIKLLFENYIHCSVSLMYFITGIVHSPSIEGFFGGVRLRHLPSPHPLRDFKTLYFETSTQLQSGGEDRRAGDREKKGRDVYGRQEKRGREAGFPRW